MATTVTQRRAPWIFGSFLRLPIQQAVKKCILFSILLGILSDLPLTLAVKTRQSNERLKIALRRSSTFVRKLAKRCVFLY